MVFIPQAGSVGASTVQMRAIGNCQTMDGAFKARQVFWTTPDRAAHYIQHRVAEYVAPVGPSEQPQAGPSETKKSLPEEPVSPLTDSLQSGESGTGVPLSASHPAPPSPPIRSQRLTLPKRQ